MRNQTLLVLALLLVGSATAETNTGDTASPHVTPNGVGAADTFRAVPKGNGEVAIWVIDTTRGTVRICALDSPGAGPSCGPWSNP